MMLSKKTLYAIYLLHRASDFYSCSKSVDLVAESIPDIQPLFDRLCKKGYLNESGEVICNLGQISLLDLLCDLEEKIDPLNECLNLYEQAAISLPESIICFDRSSRLWLRSIKLNQL